MSDTHPLGDFARAVGRCVGRSRVGTNGWRTHSDQVELTRDGRLLTTSTSLGVSAGRTALGGMVESKTVLAINPDVRCTW